uniref:Uncharacterized protein n=1 Tax=Aegilops tauschii subsp. strangulata TaxID=200361 RepID=A0A453FC23_AEGTS
SSWTTTPTHLATTTPLLTQLTFRPFLSLLAPTHHTPPSSHPSSIARVSSSIYLPRNASQAAQPHTHTPTLIPRTLSSSLSPLSYLRPLFGMGNFASCTLARIPGAAKGARVVLPDGGLRLVRPPATAAELMLEAPGHFLTDARALQAGRRIEALAADDDLELGGVYAAFPMKRLGSKAAPADVARLAAVFAREAHARRPASAKVAAIVVAPPEAASVAAEAVRAPRLDEMAVDDEAAAAEIGELKQRISGC